MLDDQHRNPLLLDLLDQLHDEAGLGRDSSPPPVRPAGAAAAPAPAPGRSPASSVRRRSGRGPGCSAAGSRPTNSSSSSAPLHGPLLVGAEGGGPEDGRQKAGPKMDLPPYQDVLHHAHLGKGLEVLEGAGHTPPGDLVGRQAGDPFPPEEDLAAGRGAGAGDGVEEGGLPSAVRADDGEDLSLADPDGNRVSAFRPPNSTVRPSVVRMSFRGIAGHLPFPGRWFCCRVSRGDGRS